MHRSPKLHRAVAKIFIRIGHAAEIATGEHAGSKELPLQQKKPRQVVVNYFNTKTRTNISTVIVIPMKMTKRRTAGLPIFLAIPAAP